LLGVGTGHPAEAKGSALHGGQEDVADGHVMKEPQRRGQGRRGVWQPRYGEHRIPDEEDYFRHCDYVHLNPVRHGYVEHPEEWTWSSFHRHVRRAWLDPALSLSVAKEWPGLSLSVAKESSPVELSAIKE